MPIHSNLGRCFDASREPGKIAVIDLKDWDQPLEVSYAALDAQCDAVALGRLKQLKTLQRLELRPSNERSGLALTDVGAKALLHSSTFTLRHLELHDADHLSEALQQQVAECKDTREAR